MGSAATRTTAETITLEFKRPMNSENEYQDDMMPNASGLEVASLGGSEEPISPVATKSDRWLAI